LTQSDQYIFKIFAEAVRTIVEYMCTRQTSYDVIDFEPQIDFASRRWWLIPVIRKSYRGEKLFEELKDHEAIKRSLELMLREEFLIKEEKADYKLFLEVLLPLAYEYVQEFGCEFVEQKFEKLFNEMVKYKEGWEVVAIAPLENFELEGAEEVIIDKYRIRKLSEWEIKEIIKRGYADVLGETFGLSLGTIENLWCIEVTSGTTNIPDLSSDINELLSIMRLFKNGNVVSSVTLEYPKMWKKTTHVIALRKPVRTFLPRVKYVLKLNEIDSFRQLWNLYIRAKDNLPEELRIALKWFNKSYEEVEVENRVLDLAIAFEAMFKSDRYDIQASKLVIDNPQEGKKTSKQLEKLRTERNFIVHQGHSKLKPDKLEVVVANAEEIFREYYRWFLEQIDKGRDYYEIINKLKSHKA